MNRPPGPRSAPRRGRGRTPAPAGTGPPPLAPLAPGARVALIALAAGIAAAMVSYAIYDPDLWQHLRVGRALWEGLGFPSVNVWTWPTLGAPDLIPSWLFRALLWPFWKFGGVTGVFAWRWLTVLATFGILLAAARAGHPRGAPGAPTGGAALFALLWCVALYRYRSQARPETLVLVLLAIQLWALESWRARGAGRRVWAVPAIAALWANSHISYYVGLFVTGAYLVDALARRAWRRPGPPPRPLAIALGASAAASFLNPWGVRPLAQPFEYFLVWSREPIFGLIGELKPPDWSVYAPIGLPVLLLLLVGLALARMRAQGPDLAALALLALLIPQSLLSQRFLGYLAVAAAPFFARDLSWALGSLRLPAGLTRPVPRAALAAAALALGSLPALLIDPFRPDLRIRWNMLPAAASDFIEREGVHGRSFNLFQQGGYLLWRFWPDRERLPFMDIHQTGTREDRRLYAFAVSDARAWRELDARHRFDWTLLSRVPHERTTLLDVLDADSTTWSLVFVDDAAALFARRDGADAAIAERRRYRWLPAGMARLRDLGARVYSDSAVKAGVRSELERCVASSPWHADALSGLVNIALSESRWEDALGLIGRVARLEPGQPRLEERRGLALLAVGRAAEALRAFDREHRRDPAWSDAGLRRGQALQALGRIEEARAAYRGAAAHPATGAEARDSLEALDRRSR